MNCSICFEEIDSNVKCLTSCNHSFHAECIERWFEKSNTCPTCREPNVCEPRSGIVDERLRKVSSKILLNILNQIKDKSSIKFLINMINDETIGVYNFHNKKLVYMSKLYGN